jgi:hypothetical protein
MFSRSRGREIALTRAVLSKLKKFFSTSAKKSNFKRSAHLFFIKSFSFIIILKMLGIVMNGNGIDYSSSSSVPPANSEPTVNIFTKVL